MLTQDAFTSLTHYWNNAMKEFFKVTDLQTVLDYRTKFSPVKTEEIPLVETVGRILAEDIVADVDLPDFPRTIVDGYALQGLTVMRFKALPPLAPVRATRPFLPSSAASKWENRRRLPLAPGKRFASPPVECYRKVPTAWS
jgi:hypothetical protein